MLKMVYPILTERIYRVSADIYRQMIETFALPGTWCQGSFAALDDGKYCAVTNPRAVAFCVSGAVAKAQQDIRSRRCPSRLLTRGVAFTNWSLIDAIWAAGHNIPHLKSPIVTWNDTICEGQVQVLDMVQRGGIKLDGLKREESDA